MKEENVGCVCYLLNIRGWYLSVITQLLHKKLLFSFAASFYNASSEENYLKASAWIDVDNYCLKAIAFLFVCWLVPSQCFETFFASKVSFCWRVVETGKVGLVLCIDGFCQKKLENLNGKVNVMHWQNWCFIIQSKDDSRPFSSTSSFQFKSWADWSCAKH